METWDFFDHREHAAWVKERNAALKSGQMEFSGTPAHETKMHVPTQGRRFETKRTGGRVPVASRKTDERAADPPHWKIQCTALKMVTFASALLDLDFWDIRAEWAHMDGVAGRVYTSRDASGVATIFLNPDVVKSPLRTALVTAHEVCHILQIDMRIDMSRNRDAMEEQADQFAATATRLYQSEHGELSATEYDY